MKGSTINHNFNFNSTTGSSLLGKNNYGFNLQLAQREREKEKENMKIMENEKVKKEKEKEREKIKRSFKKGIDIEESKKRRDETTVELRKVKREDRILKKRKEVFQETKTKIVNTLVNKNTSNNSSSTTIINNFNIVSQDPNQNPSQKHINPFLNENNENIKNEKNKNENKKNNEKTQDKKDEDDSEKEEDEELGWEKNFANFEKSRAENETKKKLQQLPQLLLMIKSQNSTQQLKGVTGFRKLLSDPNPPIDHVIDCGSIPILISFLDPKYSISIRLESIWVLINILAGDFRHTKYVVDRGGFVAIMSLFNSGNLDLIEHAIWALRNIAAETNEKCLYRDMVLKSGALTLMLKLCTPNARQSLLLITSDAINFMSKRTKPYPPSFQIISAALPTLKNLLYHEDDEIVINASDSIALMAHDETTGNIQIETIVKIPGIARRLVELLMHKNWSIKKNALTAVGEIASGSEKQAQVLLQANVLPCLLPLLSHEDQKIQKLVCWTLSNIAAGNSDQVHAIFESNLILPLISMFDKSKFDIQREIIFIFANCVTIGLDQHVNYLVKRGVVSIFCKILKCHDSVMIRFTLDAIEHILKLGAKIHLANLQTTFENPFTSLFEKCDGITILEGLQKHKNEEIYDKTRKIITTYFESDTEETIESNTNQNLLDSFKFGDTQLQSIKNSEKNTLFSSSSSSFSAFSFSSSSSSSSNSSSNNNSSSNSKSSFNDKSNSNKTNLNNKLNTSAKFAHFTNPNSNSNAFLNSQTSSQQTNSQITNQQNNQLFNFDTL